MLRSEARAKGIGQAALARNEVQLKYSSVCNFEIVFHSKIVLFYFNIRLDHLVDEDYATRLCIYDFLWVKNGS